MIDSKAAIGTPEYKLNSLLKFKMEIQKKELTLQEIRKELRKLIEKNRSLSQEISNDNKTLFNMI